MMTPNEASMVNYETPDYNMHQECNHEDTKVSFCPSWINCCGQKEQVGMPNEVKKCPGHIHKNTNPAVKRIDKSTEVLDGENSDFEEISGLIKGSWEKQNELAFINNDKIGKNIMNAYQKASENDEKQRTLSSDTNLLSEGEDEALLGELGINNLLKSEDKKSPTRKKKLGTNLDWSIEDLKAAIVILNENDDIKAMLTLFRDERRRSDSLDHYRDCCDILETELDELRREHLGENLASYELALEQFESQLGFRDFESVSSNYN